MIRYAFLVVALLAGCVEPLPPEFYVPFYERKPINIGDTREHVAARWAGEALQADVRRSVFDGAEVEWVTFCETTWFRPGFGPWKRADWCGDDYDRNEATVRFVNGRVDSIHY